LASISNGELTVSDGAGGRVFTGVDVGNSTGQFLSLGDTAVYISSNGVSRTDGTEAGTFQLASFPDIRIKETTVANGTAYFLTEVMDDRDNPHQALWATDGTPGGTLIVVQLDMTDLFYGTTAGQLAATPEGLTFFHYEHAFADIKVERWVSDGTLAGTRAVDVLTTNRFQGSPEVPTAMAYAGGKLFTTDKAGHLAASAAGAPLDSRVFISPQVRAESFAAGPDGLMYFVAPDPQHGRELWVSDGTSAGTHIVVDLNPGLTGSDPSDFAVFKGNLYFSANQSGFVHLWKLATGGVPEQIHFADGFLDVEQIRTDQAMNPSVRFRVFTEPQNATDGIPLFVPTFDPAALSEHPDGIQMIGPDGTPRAMTLVGVSASETAPDYVTYELAAPGGAFGPADSGTYVLELENRVIPNRFGELVSGRTIGSFDLNVPASGPDLVAVASPKFPTVLTTDKRYRLPVIIENRGDARASGPLVLRLSLAYQESIGTETRTDLEDLEVKRLSLAPGKQKTLRVSVSFRRALSVDDHYRVLAEVDSDGQFAETNETNNQTDGPTFMLVVNNRVGVAFDTSLGSPPPAIVRGQTVQLPVVLQNGGNVRIRGDVRVSVYTSSDGFPSADVRLVGQTTFQLNLKPGQFMPVSVEILAPADLQPVAHELRVDAVANVLNSRFGHTSATVQLL
jgi:ELWxxDGT repeat protein